MIRHKSDELTDIACELRGETAAAYRIFDGMTTVWVPKSQVELSMEGSGRICTMPIWLAREKGLI